MDSMSETELQICPNHTKGRKYTKYSRDEETEQREKAGEQGAEKTRTGHIVSRHSWRYIRSSAVGESECAEVDATASSLESSRRSSIEKTCEGSP